MIAQVAGEVSDVVETEWPERLRRGVRSALRLCEIDPLDWVARGYDVHHVIAAGLAGAEPGRRLLARWSISVHSVVNAAIIPRSFHQGQGLHRHEFLHSINMRLASAGMFADALMAHGGFAAGRLIMLQTIQKIGIELVARSEDAAAVRLQEALQTLLTRSAVAGGSGRGSRSDDAARSTVRHGPERFHVLGGRARVESASAPRPRRPGVQHAAACP